MIDGSVNNATFLHISVDFIVYPIKVVLCLETDLNSTRIYLSPAGICSLDMVENWDGLVALYCVLM